jgi:hypothetical protein
VLRNTAITVRALTSDGARIRGNVRRGERTSGTPCPGRLRSRRVGNGDGDGLFEGQGSGDQGDAVAVGDVYSA